jgi:hypothetical protein
VRSGRNGRELGQRDVVTDSRERMGKEKISSRPRARAATRQRIRGKKKTPFASSAHREQTQASPPVPSRPQCQAWPGTDDRFALECVSRWPRNGVQFRRNTQPRTSTTVAILAAFSTMRGAKLRPRIEHLRWLIRSSKHSRRYARSSRSGCTGLAICASSSRAYRRCALPRKHGRPTPCQAIAAWKIPSPDAK